MSMMEACVADTESVDLSFNDDGELEADVRLAVDGTVETIASGVRVRFGASSGFGTNANGLIVDVQAPGLVAAAAGIGKVTTASGAGWNPGSADDTVAHNFPVARGSTTTIFASSQTVSVASTVPTRIIFMTFFSARIRTTWLNLGDPATHQNDEVGLQLQTNYNNAGWVNMDRYELPGNNQRVTANLKGVRSVLASSGGSHVMQFRGVVTGGIASATAIQGYLERSFYKGQFAWW